jgi:hypothetical protein
MLSTKIRTAIIALVAASSFAAASVVPAVSQARVILASETCDREGPSGVFEGSECETKGYETEALPSGESEAKPGGEAPSEACHPVTKCGESGESGEARPRPPHRQPKPKTSRPGTNGTSLAL